MNFTKKQIQALNSVARGKVSMMMGKSFSDRGLLVSRGAKQSVLSDLEDMGLICTCEPTRPEDEYGFTLTPAGKQALEALK